MAIYIEVLSGVLKGKRFKMELGLKIGRSQGDIRIADPKISSLHAEVQLDGKKRLVLRDLGSANGFNFAGRKVRKIALLNGVDFLMGATSLRVIEEADIKVEESASASSEPAEDDKTLAFKPSWQVLMQDSLNNPKLSKPGRSVEAFLPAVKLEFVRGIQAQQELVLGYGPRSAGAESLDIDLLDEQAPKEAFKITPSPAGPICECLDYGRVLLNRQMFKTETLKNGDLISFGGTAIKVLLL